LPPTQVPFEQVSVRVQPFPSVQLGPVSGVTVHEFDPLQARVLQASLVHVMPVPTQFPEPLQASENVQALPSLQLPLVRGVDAHVLVPLHDRVTQEFGLLAHVIGVPAQFPEPLQASEKVQALPSSQVPVVRGVVAQVDVPLQESVAQLFGSLVQLIVVPTQLPDPLHVSVWVHRFPSSQLPLVRGDDAQVDVPLHDNVTQESGSLVQLIPVPTHVPEPLQVSENVHALPSLQLPLVLGVDVQVDVPLQDSVEQALGLLVQVIAVPAQVPAPLHVSVWVQRFPSLQLPLVLGADAQVLVPLQESVVHEFGSLVHVIAVPTHVPDPLHVSPNVHRLLSLQLPLVRGVEAQVLVPLQLRVAQEFGLLVQVIAVPTHVPAPLHVSEKVQALPSLQLPLVRVVVAHVDVPLQVSVVHAFGSVAQVIGVPTHVPAALQVSENVHALPSLQLPLVRVVDVQVDVPLQASVVHEFGSVVQVIGVPTQVPAPLHVSENVQALPSLQVPLVLGVDAHVDVPLQLSVAHELGLLVQVIGVPTQVPDPLHVSVWVQRLPSLQLPLVRVVEVHVDVPLQLKATHEFGSLVQVTAT
jgi:hypothetical protein